jgi:hypothetical protein
MDGSSFEFGEDCGLRNCCKLFDTFKRDRAIS